MHARSLLAAAVAAWSCLVGGVASAQIPVRLEYVTGGLKKLTDIAAPTGDDRLFVTEQHQGRIQIIDATGQMLPAPFLTLGPDFIGGGERGLLGLCFHPDYAANGHFFVTYTDAQMRLVLSRFTRSSSSTVLADVASEVVLLRLDQPFAVHKGADMAFGPDGLFYMTVGDGGGSGDGTCRAQELDTLLGKVLRLDVDAIDALGTYAIPPGNPLIGVPGARPEILHGGLRNPWRFAIDPLSGDLWVGDVGETQWEEINWADADEVLVNWGWKIMEGPDCFTSPGCNGPGYLPCDSPLLRRPISAYTHVDGCAVIGGQVYRGAAIPAMDGMYIYADFCSAKVWAVRGFEGELIDIQEISAQLKASVNFSSPTAICLDGFGEIVMATIGGDILRFVPEPVSPTPVHPLSGDVETVSLSLGGAQNLTLDGGPLRAGQFFFMAGSSSGTHPGVPVGGTVVPIQLDQYTLDLLNPTLAPPLSKVFGILDAQGRESVRFELAPGALPVALAGLELHHVFLTFGRHFGFDFCSNAEGVRLDP